MDAPLFPVAPQASSPKTAAPRAAASQNQNSTSGAGKESDFGPTLDKAINGKQQTSSSEPQQQNTSEKQVESEATATSRERESTAEETKKASTANWQYFFFLAQISQKISTRELPLSHAADGTGGHGQQSLLTHNKTTTDISFLFGQMQQSGALTDLSSFNNTLANLASGQGQQGANSLQSFLFSMSSSEELAALAAMARKSETGFLVPKSDTITWSGTGPNNGQFLFTGSIPELTGTAQEGLASAKTAEMPLSVERFFAGLTETTPHSSSISRESSSSAMTQGLFSGQHVEMRFQYKSEISLRDSQRPSLRHDLQSQFFDTKIQQQNATGEQGANQQFLDGESETGANQQTQLFASGKGNEKSIDSTFSQSIQHLVSEKGAQQSGEVARPAFTSSFMTQVHENEILQQVSNRFRLNQLNHNSKLVMRLHPAELGSLKIDIHLRDGTVNANIVAQSQRVQEVLEKNMPRLKALMEDQGMVVNDIAVSLDTDVAGGSNMFDEQLAQENSGFTKSNSQGSIKKPFTLELEEQEVEGLASSEPEPGVNLTV